MLPFITMRLFIMSTITAGSVGIFNYTLHNSEGELLDNGGGEPMAFLHGYGNVIPGLEKELEGKAVGDAFNVTIAPADAYGEFEEQEPLRVHQSNFGKDFEQLFVGAPLHLENSEGEPVTVFVEKKEGAYAYLTKNHPLAGQTLVFDIELIGIRAALPVEIEHGHPHGIDGTSGHHH
jgi:FKBP-type peptidyl-prolyl cis-trans isomerase SlyD